MSADILNFSAQDYNEEKLLINSGLGNKWDGVNSNGYILFISSAKPGEDIGLDDDQGNIIDEGKIFSIESSMEMPSTSSTQKSMNLIFNSNVIATSIVIIKDLDGVT